MYNALERMYCWPKELVAEVKKEYVDDRITLEAYVKYDVDWSQLRSEMFDRLKDRIKRTLGVDINSYDCITMMHTDIATSASDVRMVWDPETHDVLFVGGNVDGLHVAICEKIGNPYYIDKHPDLHGTRPDDTLTMNIEKITYIYAGWNPDKRCWVYRLLDESNYNQKGLL